jgi:hypothetical protein
MALLYEGRVVFSNECVGHLTKAGAIIVCDKNFAKYKFAALKTLEWLPNSQLKDEDTGMRQTEEGSGSRDERQVGQNNIYSVALLDVGNVFSNCADMNYIWSLYVMKDHVHNSKHIG